MSAKVADEARVGVQVLGEGGPFERGGDLERLRRMAGTFGEIERGAEVLGGPVQLTQAIEAEAHEAQAEYLAEGALGGASRLLELPVDLEGAFVVAGEVGIAGSIVEGAEARRQGARGSRDEVDRFILRGIRGRSDGDCDRRARGRRCPARRLRPRGNAATRCCRRRPGRGVREPGGGSRRG